MQNQNRAGKNGKAKDGGSQANRPVFTLNFETCDRVLAGLSDLSKAFPIFLDGRRNSNPALMAGRILEVALANVEIVAPRISSMILYCQSEGMNQNVYLESLIETKFKKKLHLVKKRRAS